MKIKNNELIEQNTFISKTILIGIISISILLLIIYLLISRYNLKNRTTKELTELNATKDKFFTIISHDLKTPITSINSLTELFYENYGSINENDKMSYIKSIKESSEKLLNLTNNLLMWSNLQTKKLTPAIEIININQIIQEEINLLKQFADKKGITFDFENVNNFYVVADKSMLEFIIRNLLSNAIKFSYKGSKINIFSKQKNENIEITVSDRGIGISNEIKDKLFNINFKSTINGTDNEKGTGLGLNLSKEFLEKINGKIWFESEYGKGSSFIISLPQANKEDIYE
jgi:signal transduction histidine kinase